VPGPGPGGQAALRDGRGPGRRRGSGLCWRVLQAGAVPGDSSLDSLGQVVPQVPPVGDLGGQRGALGCALGVASAAVPADDLHAGMGVQPGAERLRRPFRQHVHRPARLDVNQDGAVDVALAQREVIDAQDQRSPVIRVGGGADEPYQRGAAHRAGQPGGQPGAGPAAQGQRDRLQHGLQAAGPAPVPGGQARYLLGERRPGACRVVAEEPAGLQVDEHFPAAGSGIGQAPAVAAVHPPRHRTAPGAHGFPGAGPGRHLHRPARRVNPLDRQLGQVRNQDINSLKIARPP